MIGATRGFGFKDLRLAFFLCLLHETLTWPSDATIVAMGLSAQLYMDGQGNHYNREIPLSQPNGRLILSIAERQAAASNVAVLCNTTKWLKQLDQPVASLSSCQDVGCRNRQPFVPVCILLVSSPLVVHFWLTKTKIRLDSERAGWQLLHFYQQHQQQHQQQLQQCIK